jgi:hypothetical protein
MTEKNGRPRAAFFILPQLPSEARARLGRLGRELRAAASAAPAVRLYRSQPDLAVLRLPALAAGRALPHRRALARQGGYRAASPHGRPGFILFVQTFGDLVNFNPHVHALIADGVFEASGRFVPLPPVPEQLLAEKLRRAVLGHLVRREAIPPALASRMLAWRHSGFSVHNRVRVAAGDSEGRKSLAGYMLRAPFSLEKMTYDVGRGAVISAAGCTRA